MADVTGLDPQFATAINAMIAASGGKLYIVSGYRSDAEQAQLYQKAVQKYGPDNAGNWVAPPGHSNHNKGLAVDLGGDLDLAHKLAPQFGLVFPMGWEPWHIEPVGARENASPQAYTTGPPGTTNPTADPSLASDPAFASASLASALMANPAEGIASGEVVGGPNPATGVASGNVGSTTPVGVPGDSGAFQGGASHPTASGMTEANGQWNPITWAHDFLSAGGFPTTPENMRAIQAWAKAEGGFANNNPLNTTQGGYAGHTINSVGVMNYNTYDDSIKANLQALTNGRYGPVIDALKAGNSAEAVGQAVAGSPWGTGTGVLRVLGAK